jgi:hypothetical protein
MEGKGAKYKMAFFVTLQFMKVNPSNFIAADKEILQTYIQLYRKTLISTF